MVSAYVYLMKLFSITLLIITVFTYNLSAKGRLIKPTNDKINYVGRFEFLDSLEPKCSYPYSSIEARFFGSFLSVSFTEYGEGGDQHTNFIEVVVDQRPIKTIKLLSGTHDYFISEDLGINYHTVKLIKRTEASVGIIGFNGIHIEEKKLYDIKKKGIKVMVVGDSWSTGYGNEVMLFNNIATGFHSKNQDASITWGSLIADYYKAELHNISCSDAGVSRGADGSPGHTMIDRIDLIHPTDTSKKWDHSQYQPDVIFVYLGSADFIPESGSIPNKLDSVSFVLEYTKLISKLTDIYPKSLILCVCDGSKSNYFPTGFRQSTRWRNYTKAVVSIMCFLEKPVFYQHLTHVVRKPWGEDWNPSKVIHHGIAFELKNYFPLIH